MTVNGRETRGDADGAASCAAHMIAASDAT